MKGRTSPVSLPRPESRDNMHDEKDGADGKKKVREDSELRNRSKISTPGSSSRNRGASSESNGMLSPGGSALKVAEGVMQFQSILSELHEQAERETEHVEATQSLLDSHARSAESLSVRLRQTSKAMETTLRQCAEELEQFKKVAEERKAELGGLHGEEQAGSLEEARRLRLFSEPVFRTRPSVLTSMLHRDRSFESIYNLAVASLIWLFLNVMLNSYFTSKQLVDLRMLTWSFSSWSEVLPTWMLMFCASVSVVPMIQAITAWNLPLQVWVGPYAVMHLFMYAFPSYVVLNRSTPMPPASAAILMCEAARFSMKMHAYVREKLLHGCGDNDYRHFIPDWAAKEGVTVEHLRTPHITIEDFNTELGRYMYFSFCPSLIYRDDYPRTGPVVRWLHATTYFFNFLMVIVFTYALWVTFCEPQFYRTAADPGDAQSFVLSVFRSMMPGVLTLVLMNYGILHCWINFWAEILRFGDRGVAYDDWWNSDGFGTYYRKWNRVVGGFLRNYVYLDTMRFSKGKIGRVGAQAVVFVISAIIHEHIVSCAMGLFYPVLLVLFGGPGICFTRITKGGTNIFLWAMLIIGTGLLMVTYAREWYARFGEFAIPNEKVNEAFHPLIAPIVPRSWLAFAWAKH